MVIDSSALIALLLSEPETDAFVTAIAGSSIRLISAASYLETTIVMLSRSGSEGQRKLDRLLTDLAATVFPFTLDQAVLAAEAYKRYGKGSGHPAGLNFGDCFTYGLAKLTGEPVLFKGNDFSRTDLASAVSQR
ncbi:MAG TPA: type II toxin-antitoxin system VapC family toxin [Stellaceae bacterium]|nr:type II toxin-antitoxin system VapC family toxin [Stellaceae bacterium]